MTQEDRVTEMDDAAFDRALARELAQPGDEDVAMLSRAVLNALAERPVAPSWSGAEVLAEPLPWAAGFMGLLFLFVGLGYASVPMFDGGLLRVVTDVLAVLQMAGELT